MTVRKCKSTRVIYLIGGCLSRSKQSFEFMLDAIPAGTNAYLIEYRNWGFDIEKASEAIRQHIRTNGYDDITFVAISLGYQLAAKSSNDGDKIIALNPCIGKVSLLPWLQRVTATIVFRYLITFVMGWISYAPIVKVNGRPYYSLRLMFDQFKICTNNKTLSEHPFRPDVLVLSDYDTIVDNMALVRHLSNMPKAYLLNTAHFLTENNSHFYYDAVIENLSQT